jgi:tellurite resistance protein TerC
MSSEIFQWGGFHLLIAILLVLDLGVIHRKAHAPTLKEALGWTLFCIVLAGIFNGYIYLHEGPDRALEFLTGYLIEKSLSVDNILVFLVVFSAFKTPAAYQYKVLYWGVIGALILRLGLIVAGIALIDAFRWMGYIFGAFLAITGVRLMRERKPKIEAEKNIVVRWAKKWMRITPEFVGSCFFVIKKSKLWATPLFLVLIAIETTDFIFALDSIPAIFAVTHDPFIIYTSNVFAILGLRSLYFVLREFIALFRLLQYGLGAILIFTGSKMILEPFYSIPLLVSLSVIITILGVSFAYSLLTPRATKRS